MNPSEIIKLSASRLPDRNQKSNRSVVSRILQQSKQRYQDIKPSQSQGKSSRDSKDIQQIKSKIRLRLVPVRRKSEQKRQTERDSQLITPPLILERLQKARKRQKSMEFNEELEIQEQFYKQVRIMQQFKKLSKMVN